MADQMELFKPKNSKPKKRVAAPSTKPRYTRYHHEKAKTPHKCDFCVLNQVDDVLAPIARMARYKRVAEGKIFYLCGPHTNDQRIVDGLSVLRVGP